MDYSDFEKKLHAAEGKNVLLGFSGGADSCALFLLLEHWRSKIPFALTAVHFEHGLRGAESLADAEFCRKTAERYGVDFRIYHLDVPENMLKNETIEAAARRMRLTEWFKLAEEFGNCQIHLAHHRDDLTENVLLRLFRGANSSGLSGLRENTLINGIDFRRIMLDNPRSEIEEFLKQENFGRYCTDATNNDCSIGRNFLRCKVLKDIAEFFPYAVKGIAQSASVCRIDADFIEKAADVEFEKIKDSDFIENNFWLQLHPALRQRVLRSYMSLKLGYDFLPGKNFLCRFEDSLQLANSGFEHKIELDDKYFYIRSENSWFIRKRENKKNAPSVWDFDQEPQKVFGEYVYNAEIVSDIDKKNGNFYFDFDALTLPLMISGREEGERFEKFGGTHTTVKAELTNHKIRGIDRENIGILRNGNGEIMLLGDFRRSAFGVIDGKKQKILQIRVEKLKK